MVYQYLADIIMTFATIIGIYFTIYLLMGVYKTKKLMAKREFNHSEDNYVLVIDDSYLTEGSSCYTKKKGF